MNAERWQAIGDLFEMAVALPPGERTALVERIAASDTELSAEVRSLIASHEATEGGFVQNRIKDAVVSFHHLTSAIDVNETHVGPYRLIRELGTGGMGVVFLAERSDDQYTAEVAIKLIRPGMDTEFIVTRFRRERQTLARLQHPNIARLLDGGATEAGLPYLVMEYIDGVPLSEYCRDKALGVRARVELFLSICSAVDYAHRNFIIHRDVKPGNILIDQQGEPKLLDFGICKLLQGTLPSPGETRVQFVTPNYASPEHIRGETVTLLTDVYSLGVVLYELLSGTLPNNFEALSWPQIQEAIANEKFPAPSEAATDKVAARALRGDLDTIILRALETDPERRYQSAALLADDLRRYLSNEPILAKRPTVAYRSMKFLRRHSVLVAATSSVIAALGIALGVSIVQTRTAHRHQREVQELASKLVFDVHDSIRDLPGATPARALIINTAIVSLNRIAESVKGDPKAEFDLARSYRRLGDVQGDLRGANLGDTSNALKSYQYALTLLNAAGSASFAEQTERLIVYARIGVIESSTGHLDQAVQTLKEGIALGNNSVSKADHPFKGALAELYLQSAGAKRNLGDFKGSLDDASQSLRLSQEIAIAGAPDAIVNQTLASTYSAIGMAENNLGHLDDAAQRFQQGATELERLVASNPGSVTWKRELMLAYGHIADVAGNPGFNNRGDRKEALAEYRKAAAIGKAIYEADPADQRAAADYATALSRTESVMDHEDPVARIAVQKESIRIFEHSAHVNPKNATLRVYLAFERQHLGDSYMALHKPFLAGPEYQTSIKYTDDLGQASASSTMTIYVTSATKLALAEVALGHREAALDAVKRAARIADERPRETTLFLRPRADGGVGKAYAALFLSPLKISSDRSDATLWLQKGLDGWKAVQKDRRFLGPQELDMHEIEDTLANVSRFSKRMRPSRCASR